jgi:hypothetical protein
MLLQVHQLRHFNARALRVTRVANACDSDTSICSRGLLQIYFCCGNVVQPSEKVWEMGIQAEIICLQQARRHRACAQKARWMAKTTKDADLGATLNEYAASLEELHRLCRTLRRATKHTRTLAAQVQGFYESRRRV